MNDYFEYEISRTEQELLDLKTSSQKSSGFIGLYVSSASISIPLSLNTYGTTATGRTVYKITTDGEAVLWTYLDWNYGDVNQAWEVPRTTRRLTLHNCYTSSGNYVVVRGYGNASDVATLNNGGSVTLTATLTVRGTQDIGLEKQS